MSGGSDSQVVGYRYLLGIHMGISRGPVDELIEIKAGDRYIWRGSVTGNTAFQIDAANVFGGEDGEGGISGTLTTMFGGPTQTAPAALTTIQAAPIPGFRRMMTVFFDGIVSMINPYPKAWKFRVRRTNEGWDGGCWYPERARITLIRPVSEAEQQQASGGGAGGPTTSIVGLAQSFDITDQLVPIQIGTGIDASIGYIQTGPVTVTLTPQFGVTVLSVDYIQYGNGLTGEQESIGNIPSEFWSVSGNTITIQPQPAYELGGPTDRPWARQFSVAYSASVVSFPPGTPGTPGGGPAGFGVATIAAMNPVHILYEVFTNREWGRGLPRDALDDANWRAAADIAFGEQFGMCIRWTRTDSIKSFVSLILNHINGALYEDRVTGKIKIQLVRGNYDRWQIPIYTTETGLLEVTDAPVLAQGPMINEIKVTYRDPVTDSERTVRSSNLANLQASSGEINSTTLDMKGLPTAELAGIVAKRELKVRSTKLRKFTLVFDRRGSRITPGGVIRIADPVRNIPDTVLRVGSVDYGTLRDGKIKVQAVQDVFATPTRGAAVMPPPTWVPPTQQPCLGPATAFEMPYWLLARTMSAADFAQVADTDAYVGLVVGEGQPMNLSYQVAVKTGLPMIDEVPTSGTYCGFLPNNTPGITVLRDEFVAANGTAITDHAADIGLAGVLSWSAWPTVDTPIRPQISGNRLVFGTSSAAVYGPSDTRLSMPHRINFTLTPGQVPSAAGSGFSGLTSVWVYYAIEGNPFSMTIAFNFREGSVFQVASMYAALQSAETSSTIYSLPYTAGQTYTVSMLVNLDRVQITVNGTTYPEQPIAFFHDTLRSVTVNMPGTSSLDRIEVLN